MDREAGVFWRGLIDCPRCQGFVEEVVTRTDEGKVFSQRCANCGWYGAGLIEDGYGPVRKAAPKGYPEHDEFILRRSGELIHRGSRS